MFETRAAWDDLAPIALEEMNRAGAQYGDVRLQVHREQFLAARNDRIHQANDRESRGAGLRALVQGSWGFAATTRLSPDDLRQRARQAVEMARAGAGLPGRHAELVAEAPSHLRHEAPCRIDPFTVSYAEKSALLLEATSRMRQVAEVQEAWGMLQLLRQDQLFASSEGSRVLRRRVVPNAIILARAVGNGDVQTRSFMTWGRHAGWEFILEADLPGQAPRVAREARDKLFAEEATEGECDLILDPEHLALTIHESIGHATELDRVLGYEADFAGTSFATTEKLGWFRYGSPLVNVVADNTVPEYLASVGCDDEGVEGQRWDLIRHGILQGYSTGREVASAIGEPRSRGSARSEGWWAPPIVRMANLGLEPGQGRLDALIADTQRGISIEGRGAFSIDQQRLDFQFGGDMFWKIEHGRRTSLLKNVIYRSRSPLFWNACDAVCGPEEFRAFGVTTCGKGQPSQRGMMTHFAAPARFRRIEVGRGSGRNRRTD